MKSFEIDCDIAAKEFVSYVKEEKLAITKKKFVLGQAHIELSDGNHYVIHKEFGKDTAFLFEEPKVDNNALIFGKDTRQNIVSIEPYDNKLIIYYEKNDIVSTETIDHEYWLLGSEKPRNGIYRRLEGNQHYKWIKIVKTLDAFHAVNKKKKSLGLFSLYNQKEAAMVRNGITYYKGMNIADVSLLSFDIETTGLDRNARDAKLLIFSNTIRKAGKLTHKLFSIDEYDNEGEMIRAWVRWVQEQNPSLVIGHNITIYDLPYIKARADEWGIPLELGRDLSELTFEDFTREKRKDGSQSYTYNRPHIFGREIVDTFFLAINYDIRRKYISYALKSIVTQEGLEMPGRVHYDGSKIAENWHIPEERKKIKDYARFDAMDSISLFDLMIPAYFYLAPHIPCPFQVINESATGKLLNSFMIRSYLQNDHSIPEPTDAHRFQGAISFGNPGLYKNVFKIDVASLYPSIILSSKLYDKIKDPNAYFLSAVQYFTAERLKNKALGKAGDKQATSMSEAQKVFINSAYGFLGANGLHFNSPTSAEFITKRGREILTSAIDWAQVKGYNIVNADTDSISYVKPGFAQISEEERAADLVELNGKMTKGIHWEDDQYYKNFLVIKAKNYVLQYEQDGRDKIKFKGSALVDQKKEPALREMIGKFVDIFFQYGIDYDKFLAIYHEYIREAGNVKDIKRWATKKTLTKAVLSSVENPAARLNETKVYDALRGRTVQEGDKIWVYPAYNSNNDEILAMIEDIDLFKVNNTHLIKRIYDTVKIFENVLDKTKFLNYTLKKNKDKLDAI